MEQYVIKGGNPLVGEVDIAGAKNAALAILSAAIMTDETILIENLPDVRDINVLLEAIAEIGAQVERVDKSTVKINGSTIGNLSVDYEFIKKIRASYYLLGALLGKYKHAEVPLPGKKLEQKIYYNHSDYVGGMKETTLKEMMAKKPEKVIELAVKGMLPKGPLGRTMYKKLFVYAGPEHKHEAQKPETLTF